MPISKLSISNVSFKKHITTLTILIYIIILQDISKYQRFYQTPDWVKLYNTIFGRDIKISAPWLSAMVYRSDNFNIFAIYQI